ncbi:MAG: polyprenyl synthetase family protein [Anaerolineae bacterium]|jgi:geranylgeranyl diphosphate synthase type I
MNAMPDPRPIEDLQPYRDAALDHIDRSLAVAGIEASYAASLTQLVRGWLARSAHQQALLDLPALVCRAAGKDPIQAAPAGAAWWLARLAAKLFDDVEDGELDQRLPEAVNLASAALAAAQATVLGSQWLGSRLNAAQVGLELASSCLRATQGQHWDLAAAASSNGMDPDQWLSMAGGKSGSALAWAAWAGAVAAGSDPAVAEHFRQYGYWLGVLLQIADDYGDTWNPTSSADLAFRGTSLALAYAHLVAEGDNRAEIESLLAGARAGNVASATKLRELLTSLGAQAFLVVAAQDCRIRASRELEQTGCPTDRCEPLLSLLRQPLS